MSTVGQKCDSGSAPGMREGVIWNVTSLAIAGLLGILANALILHVRGYATLGVFNQVYAIYIVASQICTLGVHLSVLRLVSLHPRATRYCAEVLVSGLIVVTASAFLTTTVLWCSQTLISTLFGSPVVGQSIIYFAPGLFFFACNKTVLNAINGANAMRAFAVFTALRFLFLFVALSVLVIGDASEAALPACFSIAEVSLFATMAIYVHRQLFPFTRTTRLFSHGTHHLWFGVRGFLSRTLTELNVRIDILMLGVYASDQVVGIYSFPALLIEGLWQAAEIARKNIDPALGSAFSEKNTASIEALARQAIPRIFRTTLLAGTGLILAYPLGLLIVAKSPSVMTSWAVFAILITGLVVGTPYRSFSGLFPQGNRPGTNTGILVITTVSNILLNILLIPVLSLYGAAAATTGAVIVEAVLIRVTARHYFTIRL